MSCPGTIAASRGGIALLPQLPHPATRKGDCKALEVRGCTSQGAARCSAVRPATCVDSAALPRMSADEWRPATGAQGLKTDELMELIGMKLHANKFLPLRQAFRAFDPMGHGTITKEALYRILCNALAGITQRQYSALLKRMNLSGMKHISFEDFYAKFYKSDPRSKNVLYPPQRAIATVAKKAETQRLRPLPRLGHAAHCGYFTTEQEFRNGLESLGLNLTDGEFESAWKKYKKLKKDCMPALQLFKELGVSADVIGGINDGGENVIECNAVKKGVHKDASGSEGKSPEMEKVEKELNMSCNSLLQTLRSNDTLNCGMITPEKLRDILSTAGIRLTPHHMTELLQRMGVKDGCLVDYKAFTNRFMSRSQDGLVHKLISDPTKGFRELKEGRVCATVDEAELQIVQHLHSKFLHLLGSFQAHDPKNCGYVTRKDFIKCIYDQIGDNSLDTQISRLVGQLCPEGDLWVPYSKFLTMFEKVKPPMEKQPPIEKELFEAVDTAKLEEEMRDLVCNKLHQFVESFISLDTNNTRRMTLPIMNDVLMRHGVHATKQELQSLWAKLVKNKDGTVDYREVIRSIGQHKSPQGMETAKSLSEDHFFLRSKTLHRDEDMMVNTLMAKMATHVPVLYNKFKTLDTQSNGLVPLAAIQLVISDLCPEITQKALSTFLNKFKADSNELVYYEALLARVSPPTEVYRTGNDLRSLLTQRSGNIISCTVPPPVLAQQPDYGLPGLKAELQKQMVSNWRTLRRLFGSMDQANTGNITANEFKAVLNQSGISLNGEQLFHLMEELDPKLSGKVNYHRFFNVILDQ